MFSPPPSNWLLNEIFILFPARNTLAAQKRCIIYGRFLIKKRWHSLAPLFGLPQDSPTSSRESVETDARSLACMVMS